MGDFFTNIKNTLLNLSSKFNKKQKMMMIIGAALIVIITAGSILYISKPEYVVLYKNLTLKESGQIVKNLDELKIQYKIQDDNSILIAKDSINKVKMDLSTKGVPSAKFSYEDLLNKNNMFMSDDEKQKAFNYALQNQLSSVIEEIPNVKKALVNLTIPQRTDFILQENKQKPKASVFIDLSEGEILDKQSVNGIATLVANSVEGLETKNVTIHDSKGKVLNDNEDESNFESSNQLELQKKVKQDIEKNLVDFLSSVYGYGNVSVMANVKLNFDSDSTEIKEYKTPVEGEENGLIRSLQEDKEVVKGNSNGGVPGTDTNTQLPTQYQQIAEDKSAYDNSKKIVNYELNEIFKKVTKAKGQIQDITVAVILNSNVLEGKELSEDKKKEISKLVSTASGLDTKTVEVYAQPFNSDISDALQKSSKNDKGTIPMWIIIMLILALLIPIGFIVGYVLIKKNNKKKEKEMQALKLQQQGLNINNVEIEELEFDIKESGYKKSIESLVTKNPEIVSQLLKSWLDEEK